jgi:hypothetical protein
MERRENLNTADLANMGREHEEGAMQHDRSREQMGHDNRDSGYEPLFGSRESDDYRTRWQDIQTGFVDEPRQAVERADGLVAEVMQQLASTFARERENLEGQWDHGDSVSTEDLRVALQRYRTFFDRLLSV